ncbi:MAG TPA: succinate--CoA ligase subunit alpha [candidate division WOR-3 bacterium]|uniref:Succinate--CoA ligase [ADP-forming] subunit alpha n=1 Tax=candidate division WOR-3 bacterium TaxID=2052148 RepID=A0A7V0T4S9_UNCW3|nr:succinate--CoA ligase subunit alpha [candidate division WOR-3 bacterium]
MSILIDEKTRVLVQGITGRDGAFHAQAMKSYGTQVVGGVTPGKGGQSVEGIPVFDSVAEAARATGADASIIFVPAAFATDAMYEAADGGLKLVVCVAEGVPTLDMVRVLEYCRGRGTRVLGPNCPGAISPGKAKVGIMPAASFARGCVGVVSRSGTLTYEIAANTGDFGQSTVIGIGGDPVIGTSFLDCLELFNADPETRAIVLVGEIGGTDEERAADWVKRNCRKPVFGFIAGQTAPPGKRMGHAGAIISGGTGTAPEKIAAFEAAGIEVIYEPQELPGRLAAKL